MDVVFNNLIADFNIGVMHVVGGIGNGTVALRETEIAGSDYEAEDTGASQILLGLGWRMSETWEFPITYHRIEAEAELKQDGSTVDDEFGLGGIMLSAGLTAAF